MPIDFHEKTVQLLIKRGMTRQEAEDRLDALYKEEAEIIHPEEVTTVLPCIVPLGCYSKAKDRMCSISCRCHCHHV